MQKSTKIKDYKSVLSEMIFELDRAPKIYHPSDFWQKLNKIHIGQLKLYGLENFKRTVNRRYFSWGILGILRHQLSPLISLLVQMDLSPLTKSHFNDYQSSIKTIVGFNHFTAFIYRSYIASLSDFIAKNDEQYLLKKLQEPLFGNPFIIIYKQRHLTQDLCNSIQEFYSIIQYAKLPKNPRIGELGAGYGRLAFVILKTLPSTSYTVIDIPPALYVSQSYLSKIFPEFRIYEFVPFKTFKKIRKNFDSAKIRFLLSSQLEKVPSRYFDLIINISALHEMTRPQIENYFKIINRVGNGYFYTKQWRRSQTKENNFISEHEYPVPSHWKTIFHRTHPVQSMFFEALYKII